MRTGGVHQIVADQSVTCRFCQADLDDGMSFDPYHDVLRCNNCHASIPYHDTTYRFFLVFGERDRIHNQMAFTCGLHYTENLEHQKQWQSMGLK